MSPLLQSFTWNLPSLPLVLAEFWTFPRILISNMLLFTNEMEEVGFHFFQNAQQWLKIPF